MSPGGTNDDERTNEQGKKGLLSLWAVGRLSFAIFPLHCGGVKPVGTKSQVYPKINFIGPLMDVTNQELVSLFFQYNLEHISLFFGLNTPAMEKNFVGRNQFRSTNNPVFALILNNRRYFDAKFFI